MKHEDELFPSWWDYRTIQIYSVLYVAIDPPIILFSLNHNESEYFYYPFVYSSLLYILKSVQV